MAFRKKIVQAAQGRMYGEKMVDGKEEEGRELGDAYDYAEG